MASSLDQAHLTMLIHLCASEPIVVQTLPVAGRVGVHFGNLAVHLRPYCCAKSQRQNLILPFLLLGFVSGLAGSKSSSCLQTPPIPHPDINCPMSLSLAVFLTLAWPPLSTQSLRSLLPSLSAPLHYLFPFTVYTPSLSVPSLPTLCSLWCIPPRLSCHPVPSPPASSTLLPVEAQSLPSITDIS
jgi:hypothetical protein